MQSSSRRLQQVPPCIALNRIALGGRVLGPRRIPKPLSCCIHRNICHKWYRCQIDQLNIKNVNYIRFQEADTAPERKDNMTLQIGGVAHAAQHGPHNIVFFFSFFKLKCQVSCEYRSYMVILYGPQSLQLARFRKMLARRWYKILPPV